jgi:cytochrome c556
MLHAFRMRMKLSRLSARGSARLLRAAILSVLPVLAAAQTPPDAQAARAAIANRKAIFTLIGNNFRPIGEALRQGAAGGTSASGSVDTTKVDTARYAARIAMLDEMLPDAFPELPAGGDTRARPEIWTNRADFDERLREFHDHVAQLAQITARHDNAAFKAAATTVAQDCKSCHDHYRSE